MQRPRVRVGERVDIHKHDFRAANSDLLESLSHIVGFIYVNTAPCPTQRSDQTLAKQRLRINDQYTRRYAHALHTLGDFEGTSTNARSKVARAPFGSKESDVGHVTHIATVVTASPRRRSTNSIDLDQCAKLIQSIVRRVA